MSSLFGARKCLTLWQVDILGTSEAQKSYACIDQTEQRQKNENTHLARSQYLDIRLLDVILVRYQLLIPLALSKGISLSIDSLFDSHLGYT